jgi:hypothetical protein
MNNPFTERWVSRIGSLYERARSLVSGGHEDPALVAPWEWHCASAQACVEEAVLIYIEGLGTLLRHPLSVRCTVDAQRPHFDCSPPDGAGFEVGPEGVVADGDAAERTLSEAFGGRHPEVLRAFADGLQRLYALGAFGSRAAMKLELEAGADPAEARVGPAGVTH